MKDKLVSYIAKEIQGDENMEIRHDEDLLASGLVESMGMMRIIQFVEEEFGVEVKPEDMTIDNFITVDAIAEFIKKAS